jgi:hypothetical protein
MLASVCLETTYAIYIDTQTTIQLRGVQETLGLIDADSKMHPM